MTRTARHIADQRVALEVPGARRRDELGVLARTLMEVAGAFVHANAELSRSVETRDEFLSLAAHELKTPLSALKLHLQGCHRRWALRSQPPTVRCMETALRQTGRIEGLIGDLLLLAEIRTGHFAIARRHADLSALVREAAAPFHASMAQSGNTLETAIAPHVACECDGPRVGRVVANLLANAAEHAPGTLVSVRLSSEGATAVLEVEDGGPGIPAHEWALVFEPYRKGGRTERVRGLGLGLFLAKQIVEAHGGSMAVAAGASGGTRFRVELPVRPRAEAHPSGPVDTLRA
jgi:signal transduction histidine kinase